MAIDLKKGEKINLEKEPIITPQEGKTVKQDGSDISPASKSGGKQKGNTPLKPILIIVGIILLILIILLLLRTCGSLPAGKQDSSTQTVKQEPSAPTEKQNQSTQTASTDIQNPPVTPDTPTLPKTVFPEKTEVLFEANSSALLPSASVWLDKTAGELSDYIKQNPDATFKVIGYVAVVYGFPDPVKLSQERANKVVSELSARNINVKKLQAISGGETNRWGNNSDEKNRSLNRRILIQQE
jgi:outer membrane protein OmpA-like peptidoglycan-associated protein